MNFNFSEKNSFEIFLKKTCIRIDDHLLTMKRTFGNGQIIVYNLHKGLNLYVFDFILKEPLLIKWEFSAKEAREYYLFHNISEKPQKEIKSEEVLVEQGAVIFARSNVRRRVWMPNVHYNVLSIHFSQAWYENINSAIIFPKQIQDNLKHTNELYLNATPTTTSALVTSQIRNHLDKKLDISIPYLEIKAIELIFLLFTDALRNITKVKTKSSIHPIDLAKLNEFMGSIYNNLEDIPNIEEAADKLGMSASKFQRLFKSLMSNSYYNYIYKIKMDAGMEFLLQGIPVSEVAFKLGYSSIGNFTNAFKKCFQLLPSDIYKNKNS